MKITVVIPPISEAVDQPGIAVEVEDDRPAEGKESVEIQVRKAVGVLMRNRYKEKIPQHPCISRLQTGGWICLKYPPIRPQSIRTPGFPADKIVWNDFEQL
jgi:hypothetical protein